MGIFVKIMQHLYIRAITEKMLQSVPHTELEKTILKGLEQKRKKENEKNEDRYLCKYMLNFAVAETTPSSTFYP